MIIQSWNADAFINKLENDEIPKALRLSGQVIVGNEKQLCLVDTGNLRASLTFAIKGEVSKVESKAKQEDACPEPKEDLVLWCGTGVNYAIYIELGTSKMGATPFLRAGFYNSKAAIQHIFSKGKL